MKRSASCTCLSNRCGMGNPSISRAVRGGTRPRARTATVPADPAGATGRLVGAAGRATPSRASPVSRFRYPELPDSPTGGGDHQSSFSHGETEARGGEGTSGPVRASARPAERLLTQHCPPHAPSSHQRFCARGFCFFFFHLNVFLIFSGAEVILCVSLCRKSLLLFLARKSRNCEKQQLSLLGLLYRVP